MSANAGLNFFARLNFTGALETFSSLDPTTKKNTNMQVIGRLGSVVSFTMTLPGAVAINDRLTILRGAINIQNKAPYLTVSGAAQLYFDSTNPCSDHV